MGNGVKTRLWELDVHDDLKPKSCLLLTMSASLGVVGDLCITGLTHSRWFAHRFFCGYFWKT